MLAVIGMSGFTAQAGSDGVIPPGMLEVLLEQTNAHDQSGEGYSRAGAEVMALAKAGHFNWQSLTVGPGSYRLLGTCSGSCSDINLEVWGEERLLGQDHLEDDYPWVDFSMNEAGEVRVKALMEACSEEECGYHLTLWRNNEESGGGGMAEQIDAYRERMNDAGWYQVEGGERDLSLAPGASEVLDVGFHRPPVRFFALCDGGCNDINLTLTGEGHLLDEDHFKDDHPFVDISGGLYNSLNLEVDMVNCREESCGVQVTTWERRQ